MEEKSIELFLAINGNKFPEEAQMEIREILSKSDGLRSNIIQSLEYKDPTTILLVSIFAGQLGIDRFLLGDTGTGVAKLILSFLCIGYIWVVIDWFMIQGDTKRHNLEKLRKASI